MESKLNVELRRNVSCWWIVKTYFGAVICNLEIALFQYFEPILYTGQHFHSSIKVREWVYQRLGCRRKKTWGTFSKHNIKCIPTLGCFCGLFPTGVYGKYRLVQLFILKKINFHLQGLKIRKEVWLYPGIADMARSPYSADTCIWLEK